MTSATDICNMALGYLGAERISNFENPKTKNEQLCQLFYPLVRDELLESRDWSFLIKRAVIEAEPIPKPEWGFGNGFIPPVDSVRILEVRDNDSTDRYSANSLNWALEYGVIVAKADKVYIRYITGLAPTTAYSGQFIVALAAELACQMCIQITENRTLKQDLMMVAADKLAKAAATDGLQGRSEQIRASTLTQARYNGGGNIV